MIGGEWLDLGDGFGYVNVNTGVVSPTRPKGKSKKVVGKPAAMKSPVAKAAVAIVEQAKVNEQLTGRARRPADDEEV